MCLFLATSAWAQTVLHVRAGAAGDNSGSNWTNACPGFTGACAPSSLPRPSTVYVADGNNYPAITFNRAASGTSVITIRKATIAEHGSNVGWLDTYGDGQAIFRPTLAFTTNHWVFDGVARGADLKSGHGFVVNNLTNPIDVRGITVQADNITLKYFEYRGTDSTNDAFNDRGIQLFDGSDNVTISHCYVHDTGETPILVRDADNLLIEHCWLARNHSSSALHSEGISISATVNNFRARYNVFEDMEGTAYIATAGNFQDPSSNWYIYGNVFLVPQSPQRFGVGDGIISCFNIQMNGDFYLVNNTFIRHKDAYISGGTSSQIFLQSTSPQCRINNAVIRNNLWYDSNRVDPECSTCTSFTWSHNAYFATSTTDTNPNRQTGSGNPFVSWTTGDFRLAAATLPGFSLGAPFNIDPDGTVRGFDGVWDRGAYDFTGVPVPRPPAPPTNLRIIP